MIAQVDTAAGRNTTIGDIEKMTARLAETSSALDEQLGAYEQELQAVNDKHLRPLKRLATVVAQAEAELHEAIERSPHLFEKPRTLTVHGIKVGFSVSEGKLVFDDEPLVIKLLKKKFPEMKETLISTTEKVNKDAVKSLGLTDDELAKLGMRIEDRGDQVLIKRSAGEIEKLLAKLKTKLVEAIVEAA
jgi:hypothetical protein